MIIPENELPPEDKKRLQKETQLKDVSLPRREMLKYHILVEAQKERQRQIDKHGKEKG